ncbi:type III secretion system outer membrane ring subunit SctC [Burkholderia cepacia]|uniref:type III secretion system outer membrane ring subunit SctC n=1 Tax=Burkholderia cepacia TaxID=292 RepID=UPI0018C8B45E|nr:type III secretion system outer membrane ring subunit SctC [Burkholderia cepacia]
MSWKQSAYAYNAEHKLLPTVLSDFAKAFGVRVSIAPALRKVVINSKLSARDAVQYLDHLAVQYGFTWFFYNDLLYVSPSSDYVTEHIELSDMGLDSAQKALQGVGLLDPKFGWGELDSDGHVLVSGPSDYVRLVRNLLMGGRGAQESDVMIFRLNNALAADRVVTLRDQRQTIPGVASVLGSLLAGGNPESHKRVGDIKISEAGGNSGNSSAASMPPLPPMPVVAGLTGAGGVGGDAATAGSTMVGGGHKSHDVTIKADPRTNSVLIRDSSAKRDLYAHLIAALDVPTIPVEIAATIIDLDTSHGREWAPELLFGTADHGGGLSTSQSITAFDLLAGATNANIALWATDRLLPRLRALESDGSARVYASPSVMTMDNVDAVLDLSQTAYLKLVGERAVDVRSISAGTMLRVTPRLQTDGRIHVYVEVEDGGIDSTGSNSDVPLVSRNTITTEAVLKENQALVIGGYKKEQRKRDTSRIPLLGSIPLIGKLFTNDSSSTSTSDRIFVISARAIRGGGESTADEAVLDWTERSANGMPHSNGVGDSSAPHANTLPPVGTMSDSSGRSTNGRLAYGDR